jgi:hypothetical protein
VNTALKTALRLLRALEDLVAQEGVLLRSRDYAQAAATRERINPLVVELCAIGNRGHLSSLAARINDLLERRREHLSGLAVRREALGRERLRLAAARERLRQMRLYRPSLAPRRTNRLNAAV